MGTFLVSNIKDLLNFHHLGYYEIEGNFWFFYMILLIAWKRVCNVFSWTQDANWRYKTFKGSQGRLLNVLFAFDLRLVARGMASYREVQKDYLN